MFPLGCYIYLLMCLVVSLVFPSGTNVGRPPILYKVRTFDIAILRSLSILFVEPLEAATSPRSECDTSLSLEYFILEEHEEILLLFLYVVCWCGYQFYDLLVKANV